MKTEINGWTYYLLEVKRSKAVSDLFPQSARFSYSELQDLEEWWVEPFVQVVPELNEGFELDSANNHSCGFTSLSSEDDFFIFRYNGETFEVLFMDLIDMGTLVNEKIEELGISDGVEATYFIESEYQLSIFGKPSEDYLSKVAELLKFIQKTYQKIDPDFQEDSGCLYVDSFFGRNTGWKPASKKLSKKLDILSKLVEQQNTAYYSSVNPKPKSSLSSDLECEFQTMTLGHGKESLLVPPDLMERIRTFVANNNG